MLDIVTSGDVLKIKLSSPESFMGYLMVVQDKDESLGGLPIGEFIVTGDGMKGVKCKEENSGVSHSNPDLKSEVTVDWKMPAEFDQENVIVRASVVYEYLRADHVKTTHTI